MNKVIMVLAFMLMTGCSAKKLGEPFSPAMLTPKIGVGTVVFYRPSQGFGLRWGIAANDTRISAISNDTFTIVELPPGPYKFNTLTSMIDTVENIEIKDGAVQYVRAEQYGWSYWTYITLKEVSKTIAQAELKGLRMQINREKWANSSKK